MATCSLMLLTTTQARGIDNADEVSQLQNVKSRTVELLAGATGAGPRRTQALASLDDRVQQILAEPAERLEWPDPAQEQEFNQRLNRFLGQVRTLAEGWASAGSRYHGNPRVLDRALAGLDNALEHYTAETPRPGNWYYWLIPIPDKLGAIGLLLEAELPPELRSRLEASLTFALRDMRLSGVNAAWEARNHAYLALLQGDVEHCAAPPNTSSPLCATAPMGVSERITVTCSMATFHMPCRRLRLRFRRDGGPTSTPSRRSGDRHHACGLHRTPRGRTITRRLRVTPRRQEGPPHPRL